MAYQSPIQTMRTELMGELKILQNMRASLRAQLHNFQLIVAATETNKLPEASILLKILNQIKQIVESLPFPPTLESRSQVNHHLPVAADQKRSSSSLDTEFSRKIEPKKIRLGNHVVPPSTKTFSSSSATSVPGVPSPPVLSVGSGQLNNPPPLVHYVGQQQEELIQGSPPPDTDVQIMKVKVRESSVITSSSVKKVIWSGLLHWTELQKGSEMTQKIQRQLPCEVTGSGGWFTMSSGSSNKLLSMQLIPKRIILALGSKCFEGVQSVTFHFPNTTTTTRQSLIKIMTTGFAGCVHFVDLPSEESPGTRTVMMDSSKIFLLLYSIQRNDFIGFIPRDQNEFRERFTKVMEQAKATVAASSNKVTTDEEWEAFVSMSSL